MRTFGWIFFSLGMLFLAIAAGAWLFGAIFRMQAEQATGTVIDVPVRHYADGNAYCPVVRFRARQGGTYTHYSDICSWPPSYEVGQEVRIYYDPQNPERVQMEDFFGTWFIPLLFGFMGLVFGSIGYFTLFPNLLSKYLTKPA